MWFFANRITRRFHHDHKKHGPHDHHHHDHGDDVASRRSGIHEIKVVRRVLDANDIMADRMRTVFAEKKVFVLNMMSSPGSGKTTILQKTLTRIMPELSCAVIVGDICTTNDADRLAKSGAPVIQINTDAFGGDCHLAAHVVERAVAGLDLTAIDLLIVENIGNLVCPAEFDIGEDRRVVVLSVTEGEDKPAKYPLMFRECDATLLNKIDLLPYLDFDMELARTTIANVHPGMPVFEISAKSEAGFDEWIGWLVGQVKTKLKD
ncbi:MAG: hydrogenase nickel incorporation protein HypB [Desulfosarcina sp.]